MLIFIQTLEDLDTLWGKIGEPGDRNPTPTGQVLDDLLSAYKAKAVPPQTTGHSVPNTPYTRPKKLMILVVTDGIASKSLDRLLRA